ncbi:unnamed protein product [Mytilus edulis]|uniref:Reverse transcriptase/retrotransposon-derived protein RNase H-like domain-containing protein n=1 Tax=Mytilus edulis TaxID=6550 RepID=A0A8S3RC45_MYTED|nr:unnamed protein product [Mytilus edulis]
MKSDKSFPQPPVATSSEISEMKDQIKTCTSILYGMNVQSKQQATYDRQNTPGRNYNYPTNGGQVTNDRNNFSGRDLNVMVEVTDSMNVIETEVFQRFRAAGLKLGQKKCSFAASSCVFIGHLISKDGIRPPPDRVKAISDYPRQKNMKELRRLLGLFNWFRKFIPNYSALVFPLTRHLKKEQIFTWRSEQETAFTDLKHKLVSDILSFPKFDLTFRLSVDTSARGIGYLLYQLDPDDETQKPRIIRFGSKSWSPWQQSYGPTQLELLHSYFSTSNLDVQF